MPAPTAPETASSVLPELKKPINPPIAATINITQNQVMVLILICCKIFLQNFTETSIDYGMIVFFLQFS